jgi:hypothetical protein
VGLTVCVVCGVSNESVGFGRAFSLQSQSECIILLLRAGKSSKQPARMAGANCRRWKSRDCCAADRELPMR